MIKSILSVVVSLLGVAAFSSAQAEVIIQRGDTIFSNNQQLTVSQLSGVTANNTFSGIELTGNSSSTLPSYGGNTVHGSAFNQAFGINAVNQNTAPGATVQQTITFSGDFSALLEGVQALPEALPQ